MNWLSAKISKDYNSIVNDEYIKEQRNIEGYIDTPKGTDRYFKQIVWKFDYRRGHHNCYSFCVRIGYVNKISNLNKIIVAVRN